MLIGFGGESEPNELIDGARDGKRLVGLEVPNPSTSRPRAGGGDDIGSSLMYRMTATFSSLRSLTIY